MGAVNLRPQAVRMVLAHGLPVVIEVVAESMAPSIEPGAKVKVAPVTGDLHPGDIVLAVADGTQLQWLVTGEGGLSGPMATLWYDVLGAPRPTEG